jgi:hypothetical protein
MEGRLIYKEHQTFLGTGNKFPCQCKRRELNLVSLRCNSPFLTINNFEDFKNFSIKPLGCIKVVTWDTTLQP